MSSPDPGRRPFGTPPSSGRSGKQSGGAPGGGSGYPPGGGQYGQPSQAGQYGPPSDQRPFGTPPPPPAPAPRFTGLLPGILSVVLTIICFPVGLILGIVAIVLSIRALRTPRPAGTRNPIVGRAVTALVTGLVATVFSVACIGLVAWMWPAVSAYAECTTSATTNTDRSICQQQWVDAVARKVGVDPASVPSLGP